MKSPTSYLILLLLLSVLLISDIACDVLLPLDPPPSDTYGPYFCSAQIYRALPNGKEFTEKWGLYTWADSQSAASSDCTNKINSYISKYMAPGFTWNFRNLAATSVVKEYAVDCEKTWDYIEISPPTYGAPLGAELTWNYPPITEARISFSIEDNDGVIHAAEPMVKMATLKFAERTGLWDDSISTYILGQRNIRFSDIFIELDTPFQLGSNFLTVKKFYIQSIGTVIAESTGGSLYNIYLHDSKYFLYAAGEKDGNAAVTSYCFVNDDGYNFTEHQGPPYAFFAFSLDFTTEILGHAMNVEIHLSKPAVPNSFDRHQPYVAFSGDIVATSATVDLSPVIAMDHDSDFQKILWFENFEASNERFLGEGNPLEDVPFTAGDHQVTAVAYDSKGSYNSATVTVKDVPNVAPVANDDSYSTDEDTDLAVGNPGVLGNDTDANGDALAAGVVSEPSHGLLILNLYGGFVYYPEDDWCGEDSFTYRAHDGTDYSNTATVTITVRCVNDAPDAVDDSYSGYQCTPLETSAPGVLNNDVDVENDPLTAIKLSDPSNGSLTLDSDGSFTYVPNSNWTGTDNFTYKANDGNDDSNTATVTITINELSPGQQIEKCLKPQIPDSPSLNPGQKTSLLAKLDAAIAKYNAGLVKAACNLLESFKNEVNSLMDEGVLPQNEGQKYLDLADDIKAAMNC